MTRLLGIIPAVAIKKTRVYAKPFKSRKGPIGYDEDRLAYDISVRYFLEPSDLKGGRCHAGNMNWSSQIYHIREFLIQKNQLILY